MKIFELKKKRTAAKNGMKAIVDLAIKEDREMADDEQSAFDEFKAAFQKYENLITAAEDAEGDEPVADEEVKSVPMAVETRIGAPAVHTKVHEYSFTRAANRHLDHKAIDGLEGEWNQRIAESKGRHATGFFVPYSYFTKGVQSRASNTTAYTGGIPNIVSEEYIPFLRNRTVVGAMGARFIQGVGGTFSLPRQNAASTMYWVGEATAPTASNATLDQVTFTPHTVAGYTDLTRKVQLQLNTNAEDFARDDLREVLERSVDLGALNGTAGNQPTGILQNSGITTVSIGTNGGALTYAHVLSLEEQVALGNADTGALGFATNAKVRASAKATAKVGTFPVFIWADDNTIIGYQAMVSNQMPYTLTKGTGSGLSSMIYGNWNDLVIAVWGDGVDTLVDPYTGSNSGNVRVTIFQDLDCQVRHNESFAKIVDIVAA